MNKKLIALLSGLLLLTSYAFALPPDPTYPAWNNRSERTGQFAPVRELKCVRNAQQTPVRDIVSGDAVSYDMISKDGITVTTLGGVSFDGAFAGILCTTLPSDDSTGESSFLDDRGHRNWGWIVVHGPVFANASAGGTNNNAQKDPFGTSRDSGKITGLESPVGTDAGSVRNTAIAGGNRAGFFMQSGDGTSTVYNVFVLNV